MFKGTFFQNAKVPINLILFIGYLWFQRATWSQICNIIGVSEEVTTNYIGFYRQLVSLSLDEEDTIIGGDGIVVEIDETKFGKRKYNRGHRVDGFWVFGGVERTPERKFFSVRVPDRSAITLSELIMRHILPGSIIHSDCWAAYGEISNLVVEGTEDPAFTLRQVNHYNEFVTSDGIHTNTIEGTWWALKRHIPKKCDNVDINELLLEQVWRRKNHENMWDILFQAFLVVHY